MITLEPIQGHLILYCKLHYDVEGVDFIEGLRRIWAVRCGLPKKSIGRNFDEYIADELYRIIEETMPNGLPYLWQIIHREIANDWKFDAKVSPIERLIYVYSGKIMGLKIREKSEQAKRYKKLIDLPKPQKQLFKRIVRGNIKQGDYNQIK